MSVLVLSDVKARLNITTTAQDTILQETIDEAESLLTARVGPLAQQTVTQRLMSNGGGLVAQYPVVSVTSAVHVWSQYTLTTTDVEVISSSTMTRRYGVGFIPGPWDVTYVAGFASLPVALKNAALALTIDLWRISRGAPVVQNGPYEQEAMLSITSDTLPRRVLAMIAPYDLNGVA